MANPLSQIQFAAPFTDIRADTAVNATSASVRRFFHPGWAAVRLESASRAMMPLGQRSTEPAARRR